MTSVLYLLIVTDLYITVLHVIESSYNYSLGIFRIQNTNKTDGSLRNQVTYDL